MKKRANDWSSMSKIPIIKRPRPPEYYDSPISPELPAYRQSSNAIDYAGFGGTIIRDLYGKEIGKYSKLRNEILYR